MFGDFLKKIFNKLANYRENGGAGSGNWGHAGRKGKIGGSAETNLETPTEHEASRRQYGRRLRELAEAYGASNVGKAVKAKLAKAQERNEREKKEIEKSNPAPEPTKSSAVNIEELRPEDYPDLSEEDKFRYLRGSWVTGGKLRPNLVELDRKRAADPNFVPDFRVIETNYPSKYVEKDGIYGWIQNRWIGKDGKLMPGAQQQLRDWGITEERYREKQEKQRKYEEEQKKYSWETIKKETGYDYSQDLSDSELKEIKKEIFKKDPEFFQQIKDKELMPPWGTDYGSVRYNYWSTPDGSIKRIYINDWKRPNSKDEMYEMAEHPTYIELYNKYKQENE